MGRETIFYAKEKDSKICLGWIQNWEELEQWVIHNFEKKTRTEKSSYTGEDYDLTYYIPSYHDLKDLLNEIEPFYKKLSTYERWQVELYNETGNFPKDELWKSTNDFNPAMACTFSPCYKLMRLYNLICVMMNMIVDGVEIEVIYSY